MLSLVGPEVEEGAISFDMPPYSDSDFFSCIWFIFQQGVILQRFTSNLLFFSKKIDFFSKLELES